MCKKEEAEPWLNHPNNIQGLHQEDTVKNSCNYGYTKKKEYHTARSDALVNKGPWVVLWWRGQFGQKVTLSFF